MQYVFLFISTFLFFCIHPKGVFYAQLTIGFTVLYIGFWFECKLRKWKIKKLRSSNPEVEYAGWRGATRQPRVRTYKEFKKQKK